MKQEIKKYEQAKAAREEKAKMVDTLQRKIERAANRLEIMRAELHALYVAEGLAKQELATAVSDI